MGNIIIFHVTAILLTILTTTGQVNSGRVLVISPTPSYSHHIVFRKFSLALNKRGHDVVFLSTHPLKDLPLTNYTEIDFTVAYRLLERAQLHNYAPVFTSVPKLDMDRVMHSFSIELTKCLYNHPDIQKLYAKNNTEKFDVIVVEALIADGSYALSYKLNAPVIGFLSLGPQVFQHYAIGNPLLPSHPSNWEYSYDTGYNVPFWKRVKNFVLMWRAIYQWRTDFLPMFDELVRHYLGNDVPSIGEIAKNMSLLMINYHPILGEARPWQQNVIFFNGLHIEKQPAPLPRDVKEFLGNATNGFIYMSLGSNMRSSLLPPNVTQAIYNVFSRLPYRVLWKFETNDLSIKHDNILISKWIPQQSVLAHPNIKLFIYQGGLQSTEEAVHYGVPLIGMPSIFDQFFMVKRMVSLGVARSLNFGKINEQVFREAILDVINNKCYKRKMTEVRKLVRDNPYNIKDHAMWWVEYVMRHKGAPHLRFSGANDPWHKRYDVDVIAFLSIISFIIVLASAIVLILCIRRIHKYRHVFSQIILSKLIKKKSE